MHAELRRLPAIWLLLPFSAAFAQVTVPDASPLAVEYFNDLFWLDLAEQAALLALACGVLIGGRGARLAAWLEQRMPRRWLLAAVLFGSGYALVYSLIRLPIDYVRALGLNPYFGRSVPEFFPWVASQILPVVLLLAVAGLAGLTMLALIRWSRKWWWAWCAGAVSIVMVGQLAIRPVITDIDSASHVPLNATEYAHWEDRLDAIASRAGTASVPIVIWQTTENDFCRIRNSVVGLGPTRRIVLADRIFTEWDARQVEAAFAHELKHYLFDNTWVPVALILILSFSGGLFVYVTGNLVCRRWSTVIGFDSLSRTAALPLILVLFQIYLLLCIPVFNLTAQRIELEADRFALEITRDNDARARVSADQCGRLWLPEDTLYARLYLHTHPSVARRIRLANEYRPWQTGDPLVYSEVISFD